MRIAEMLARGRPTVSFEFMAPRDENEVAMVEKTIAALAGHAPDWVSVTYRKATGKKTLELVTRIKRQYHIEAMAHLTCANTADETRPILNWMEREGVANVLALRGDPPGPGQAFVPADPQFQHGSDLVAFLRRSGYRFGIGAACSAEKHPESPDQAYEFRYMQMKVDSGADFLITQLFFDNRFYFDLVRRAKEAGITIPIVPGLMPVPSRRSLAFMAAMTGWKRPRTGPVRPVPNSASTSHSAAARSRRTAIMSTGSPACTITGKPAWTRIRGSGRRPAASTDACSWRQR